MNIKIDPRLDQSYQLNTATPKPQESRNHKQLRESTREFEALYVYEVYKAMRKNVPDNGLIEKSFSSKMFQEMLDMEMAKQASAGKGIGIGEAMYDQLKDNLPTP